MEESYSKTKSIFDEAGQSHVFTFWDSLSATSKQELLENLKGINPNRCNRIFKQTTTKFTGAEEEEEEVKIETLPKDAFSSLIELGSESQDVKKWKSTGLELISKNKIALILLAGGQGTRLGSSAPKGCYDILLPSHKSLFQYQAERILRLQNLATQLYHPSSSSSNDYPAAAAAAAIIIIPWYIMTSGPTRKATESFFKSKDYFGLDSKNVIFFEQGILPAFTESGKIFMENQTTPAVAPDGNGGIYAALRKEGILDDLMKRKIPYVHAYCVDNCLVKVADPTFIGYCISKNAEMGCKSLPKRSPTEPVGIICLKNGKFNVVEYSEIINHPQLLSAQQSKKNGNEEEEEELVFYDRTANIANHFYTTHFLNSICSEAFENQLDYHIAKKKIKHIDLSTGALISPEKPNGIKLELFIFDILPHASKVAVLEVPRSDEFSPLKNAPNSPDGDSPNTSRADIMRLHARYLRNAGAIIERGEEEEVPVVEISPLVTYDGENLESFKGRVVRTPAHIENV